MSSIKELLCIESHYFSTPVTRRLSVKESLALCNKVNLLSSCCWYCRSSCWYCFYARLDKI